MASPVEQFACRSSKLEHLYVLFSNNQDFEECDARNDAIYSGVGFKKIISAMQFSNTALIYFSGIPVQMVLQQYHLRRMQ